MRRMLKYLSLAAIAIALQLSAGARAQDDKRIRIGFFPGPYADQFKRGVQPVLEKQGYKVQATEFSNIMQPNTAVMDGSLEVNVFQNRAFLSSFNEKNKSDLVEVMRIPSAPLGLYSKKFKSLAEIKDGSSISLSNEPTSLSRSLVFLQSIGLIKLDPGTPAGKATEKSVAENPKKLKLTPLDAPQIPRSLADVDVGLALGNHVLAAGMLLTDALALEDPAPQFQIIVVAKKSSEGKPWLNDLIAAYKSAEYKRFVETDPKAKGFSKPDYWR
jgi:D-methionine transport system substrate-binding protein